MEKQNNGVSLEEFHKEIDLIQSCITRMSQNSFLIKGLAFTLATAFFAFTVDKLDIYILCSTGIFVFLMFWYLDAFFLQVEMLYRFKYEWVIEERPKGNREYMYELNPYQSKMRLLKKVPTVVSVMFSSSRTLLLFYGSPILLCIIVVILRATCII